jgi:oligosaccharyltransferase complex subunit gamma
MRVFQALTLFLLPFGTLASKKSTKDAFKEFHAKQLSSGAALRLNDDLYGKLTAAPRNYSASVLLTAMDARYGCQMCREFQPEWDVLSKSWIKGDKPGNSRLVFGTLDFNEGSDTFKKVYL